MKPSAKNCNKGFSLVELSVVLVIVGLLIGGMLLPLSAQSDIRGRQETDRALATIRDALIGFAIINGRLPCPAPATLATGATGVGLEATTAAAGTTATNGPCGCTLAESGIVSPGGIACSDTAPTSSLHGVIPWATLGVPETDAWGSRYTYRVTTRFTRVSAAQTDFGCTPPTNPTIASFALCSIGDMSVSTAVINGTSISSSVPAIVISHGKNTLGAYTSAGTQIAGATSGSDEEENANGNNVFISSSSIDDQLIWVPTSILMGRMLAAGKLP